MHAISLTGPSLDHLARVEVPDPLPPGHGQILVRMRAASLNFIDLAVVFGQYPGINYPLIPVADGAGEVISIGDGVTGLAVGDRVAVHPKAIWFAGRGTMEKAATTRGVSLPGSLIEIATVDAASAVKLADHLSYEAAATLPIAATTAWNALVCADVGPGSTIVLLGTGGVSVFALQLAKARGARVIVTSSSDVKLALARELGADETINYSTSPDWDAEVLRLTNGLGADLVLDTVGSATFGRSIAATRYGGVIFTIGFITGTSLQLDLMPVIVKALRIQGNNTGSVEDFGNAMRAIHAARIEPVLANIFGLGDIAETYRAQSSGPIGKVAIRLNW
ncbi:zinc-dependent alcohol dehydrogenase family protein [Rhizobium jaguaris]|uniref:NAD(P)-dependent alcohol dehydrogenase n=1 Tax=Rhizobium jaguaris TaxID=1312183 RepID=A0A387FTR7_9HYPH|nr:NAD(P)-dependent alcohol dehydrogenase [Rhizobium jaguaris]AYG61988.1 NAD(P)-dependent alcohol dehydrogenase [Rhizobium jaguaris]